MNKKYFFKANDYNQDGFHKTRVGYLFIDFVQECERNFYEENKPLFGNGLFASVITMNLLKSCSNFDDNEILGIETSNGEIDHELNSKIEAKSDFTTYRAMGSVINGKEYEPVWLVVDSNLSDSEFILKYIQDNGNEKFSPCPEIITKIKV